MRLAGRGRRVVGAGSIFSGWSAAACLSAAGRAAESHGPALCRLDSRASSGERHDRACVERRLVAAHRDAEGAGSVPGADIRHARDSSQWIGYFRHQLAGLPARPLRDWGRFRWQDAVLSVLWLYRRSGEALPAGSCPLLRNAGIRLDGGFRNFPYTEPITRILCKLNTVEYFKIWHSPRTA